MAVDAVNSVSSLKEEIKALKKQVADLMGKLSCSEATAKAQLTVADARVEAAVKAAESEMQKKVSAAFQDGMGFAKTFILESRQMK